MEFILPGPVPQRLHQRHPAGRLRGGLPQSGGALMLRQAQQPLTTEAVGGLDLSIFPWEDAATYVADAEAYLAETEAKFGTLLAAKPRQGF